MEELLQKLNSSKGLDERQMERLSMVSDWVANYEEQHYPFEPVGLLETIRLRMFQRKMRQKDLAKLLDISPSRVSEILNGKRNLTFEIAQKLHSKLNIDAEVILR